jgi:hypothetical protein
MKGGAMEEAAKAIEKLAHSTLPERPHHLTPLTPDQTLRNRFPEPTGFWYTGASGPLQYTTFVCDVTRGLVYTRPRYELCDEPDSTPAALPARPAVKGEGVVKKKMNLKDYQNRKKSITPTDAEALVKMEVKQNWSGDTKASKSNGVIIKEEDKPKQSVHVKKEARTEKAQIDVNGDRYGRMTSRFVGRWGKRGANR